MKSFTLTLAVFCALCAVSFAGSEQYSGKEMKQVAAPAPCPEWYSDTEWNVSIWGAYAWSATDNNRSRIEDADDLSIFGTYDRFLAEDHAWGGGLDVKYFFHRYFGVGIEGVALSGKSRHGVFDHAPDNANEEFYSQDNHTIGGALGTVTLRYPFRCTRFSPYIWGGFGGFFNGNNDKPAGQGADSNVIGRFMDNKDENKMAGQVGGGLEVRVTRHIGITGDVSWNFLDGPHNNFGMVRSGLNFAF
jgi:opacity protein-like surface antigen